MSNVITLSSYIDEYLYYIKINHHKGKKLKTIIRINKKMVSPYDIALIIKKFNPIDFDLEKLDAYLLEHKINFKLFLPLKNTKGFYTMHFPENFKYMDHYNFQDEKCFTERRDAKDFEYLNILNKKVNNNELYNMN